jgi:hypothetical protein
MHFANPSVLWALFLLIIPIIIHLFKFRRYKQVQFPSIRFLQKIDQDQKAKRRLKDILILLSRLAALSALIFAFSIPFLGETKKVSKGNVVSIYIDNSFSMENESNQGKLLDLAKKKAEELALTFQPSDQFQLLTNDMETRHQRLVNRQAFLQFLYEVDLSAASMDMSEVYIKQTALLEKENEFDKWIAFISDMQQSTSDLEHIENREDVNLLLIPIAADNYNNVYIDTLWFEDPVRQLAKNETLHLRVVNESDENVDEMAITLEINGQMKSMANMAIAARSTKDTLLHYSNSDQPGIQNAIVRVNDKPIEFDNDYYFTYNLKDKINVIEVSGEGAEDYYRLLFNDSLYTFSSYAVDQIDYPAIADADLLIFNDLNILPSGLSSFILKWLDDGGNLYMSPGEKIRLEEYGPFLANLGTRIDLPIDSNERRVNYIEIENTIFKGVLKEEPVGKALPNTYQHYRVVLNDLNWLRIFELQGNDPFLATRKVNKGKFYLQSVASKESWSNWPRHALFITSLLRIAEESQRGGLIDHTIGDWSIIELQMKDESSDRPLELKAKDGSIAFIPTQQWLNGKLSIGIKDELRKAGFYNLMNQDQLLHTLAFNYSRKESNLRFHDVEYINLWKEDQQGIRLIDTGNSPIKKSTIREEKPLWKYFIMATILFLLIEVLIIKVMKQK